MLPQTLWVLCVGAVAARAQYSFDAVSSDAISISSGARSGLATSQMVSNVLGMSGDVVSFTQSISTISGSIPTPAFTGSQFTYLSYDGQSMRISTSLLTIPGENETSTSSSSSSQISGSSESAKLTQINGLPPSTAIGTASSTSTGLGPTNTAPCNGYPEFCSRRYSDITEVCAHNAAFSVPNNLGSNQALPITDQLNDGVRMLQGQTHWVNNTVWNCHTSCDLLNVGTWQAELEVITRWIESHSFDVITLLVGNGDLVPVENYVSAIQNSGIAPYLYEPEYIPQYRDQWPTLSEMILTGKRVVMFIDYNANQSAVPYILDEFSHLWETPFSPTNRSFPCTQQRPPDLNQTLAREKFMYMANHNLNMAVDLGALLGDGSGEPILIPNTAVINQTNGRFLEFGQLGQMADQCDADWGHPPNFLLVDFYNYGDPGPGSVFEVAAHWNNVTYHRPCCGVVGDAAPRVKSDAVLVAAMGCAALMAL